MRPIYALVIQNNVIKNGLAHMKLDLVDAR